MFSSLPQEIQDEIEQLSQRYGKPLTRSVDLHANKAFDPLNKTDRYGEVCMVIRRPNGRLLTMIKTFYPADAYRLLTGGINHGEHIFHALLRETREETGLEVNVVSFLASAAYYLPHAETTPNFFTFAFLLDEIGGTLSTSDEEEHVGGFREIMPTELPAIADHLEHVGNAYTDTINGRWSDWGEFRAVIHRLVWEALQQ